MITGGPAAGAAFSALPLDHLLFTGSSDIAKHVQRSAADNLVPVTLELGGKNPMVVGRDADIATAASRAARGRLLNGGQVCLCPDYVFVPTDRCDDSSPRRSNSSGRRSRPSSATRTSAASSTTRIINGCSA